MGGPGSGRRRTFAPIDTTFNKCPSGHDLPNAEDGKECTSAACGLTLAPKDTTSARPHTEDGREEMEARRLLNRELLRNRLVPVPKGLGGAAADDYAEKKYGELLPIAMGELEWALRFGTDAERYTAARDVRDATGHGKKERGGVGANMIVINMGGNNGNPPPLPYVGEIVEAATKAIGEKKALPNGT